MRRIPLFAETKPAREHLPRRKSCKPKRTFHLPNIKSEMAVNFKSDYLVRRRDETKQVCLEVTELVTSSPSQEYRQQ